VRLLDARRPVMYKHVKSPLALVLLLFLAGCESPSPRDPYDLIKNGMNETAVDRIMENAGGLVVPTMHQEPDRAARQKKSDSVTPPRFTKGFLFVGLDTRDNTLKSQLVYHDTVEKREIVVVLQKGYVVSKSVKQTSQ
jgi:hypothetical protein